MMSKVYILTVFITFMIAQVYSQEMVVLITLSDTQIIEECHFGDEWEAHFSFGGEYRYPNQGDSFVLKPNQEFELTSIIFEGNETYNDYEEKTTIIKYDQLHVGRFSFEELVYVEDENTGRYHCNNATFKFSYLIEVSLN